MNQNQPDVCNMDKEGKGNEDHMIPIKPETNHPQINKPGK